MTAKTEVKEVLIYRRSATVIRSGIAKLEAGRNLIFIAGMTKTADQGSFILKFPPTVKAVNMQIVNIDDVDLGEQKESDKIREKVSDLAYQINTCNLMSDLYKTNGNFTGRMVSVEDQEMYLKKLPEELDRLQKELRELSKAQDLLAKELEEVEKEEEKPLIMAELITENAEEVPFILQYQENSAGWTPKYEVRFSDTASPLAVSMKAKINQSSKEDWKQVKVTLYTGNPVATDAIPNLRSLQLSIYEPVPPQPMNAFMGMNMAAMSAPAMGMAAAAAGSAMGNPMMSFDAMKTMASLQTEEAAVSEDESMTAFELPSLRDILSDTSGNVADLKNFSVDAKYHVLAIPKISNKCYMTAEIVASDWPLPPARASVYLKDSLAGEFYVDAASNTDTFNLSLGNDERITLVRTELPRKTQEALIKNQKKTLYAYRISLMNNSSEAVDVKIMDQIPVSTEKTIVVDTMETSGAVINEESGELSWEFSAESKKEKLIHVSYSVAWPKDKKLKESYTNISTSTSSSAVAKTCTKCGQTGITAKFCPNCGSVM